MPRGGARPGAGRPRKAEKHARPIAKAEKRIADHLPELIDNMFVLAAGGYERVTERWEAAGSVFVDEAVRNASGDVVLDGKGNVQKLKVLAYPDLDPSELVLVQRTVETADRDRQANEYLINRIMGRPTEHLEADTTVHGQLHIIIDGDD